MMNSLMHATTSTSGNILEDNLDDLLHILQTAEDVVVHPISSSDNAASGTIGGFHPSVVPFPDPIPMARDSMLFRGASLAPPKTFPKPLGKLKSRLVTPPAATSSFLEDIVATKQDHPDLDDAPLETFSPSLSKNESFSSLFLDEILEEPSKKSATRSHLVLDVPNSTEDEDPFSALFLEMDQMPGSSLPHFMPSRIASTGSLIPATVNSNALATAVPTSTKARPSRYQPGPWNQRLQELKAFHAEHGHVLVPHIYKKNPQLSQWVKRQRYQYRLKKMGRHSTLSDDREAILNRIGFVWESHKQSWKESFQLLQAFHYTHGHCRVTKSNGDDALNTWCKHQRRQYKRFVSGQSSHMTMERIQALESLQFDWDPRNLLCLR